MVVATAFATRAERKDPRCSNPDRVQAIVDLRTGEPPLLFFVIYIMVNRTLHVLSVRVADEKECAAYLA
jgi:uncharacterized DUF497 family protein